MINRLSDVCAGKEQQYLFQTLADLIIEIAKYLAPENEKGKVEAMGGTENSFSVDAFVEQCKKQNLKI